MKLNKIKCILLKLKNLSSKSRKYMIERSNFEMINSLFMLGSSYNKNRKVSVLFLILWISNMVINYNFSLGIVFPIINASIVILISIVINRIKSKKLNTVLSVLSILIWSIVIDIICYFMFPVMRANQNIIQYIFQGILFNYKYVFINIFAISIMIYVNRLLLKRHSIYINVNKYDIDKSFSI